MLDAAYLTKQLGKVKVKNAEIKRLLKGQMKLCSILDEENKLLKIIISEYGL